MTPHEVPFGAVVLPCLPGKKPDAHAPLKHLVGGVPARAKWYPCDLDGSNICAGYEYDAILEGVRFAPAKAYSLAGAPCGHKFAIFVDGKRIKYTKYPRNYVEVTKLTDGTFMSTCGYAYDHWLRRYELPKKTILMAHGTSQRDATIDDAVVLPVILKDSDVWKMLRGVGAKFMSGTRWNPGDPEYFHVWLPSGWKVMPKEPTYENMRQEVVIDDNGGERAVARWVTLGSRAGGSMSLI